MGADGSVDIYPRLAPTMEWDTYAAHLILNEGLSLQSQSNCELKYNKPNLLNPHFIAFANGLSEIMPGGEIGRHKGLKILEGNFVPVQVSPGHHIIFIRYFEKFYSCWRRICWDVSCCTPSSKV